MNLIFGVIILAMFILALRVIWATGLQVLAMLQTAMVAINRYRALRNARASIPVIMPRINHEVDWEVMSDTVRKEIHRRNSGFGGELDRLDRQYQAKQKTIKLYEADIEIARLERELQKIKPVVINPVPEVKKRHQSKNRSAQEQVVLDEVSSKTPHQVYQLREALKGAGVTVPVNQQARH
ncbi:hypothetical protein [Methylomonas sp. AM2-LC]|uniref:hypothetical protein n=1 Tax=Methylomonas sp. AM2-LC TaxID=3153301 RepID=UPI003263365B